MSIRGQRVVVIGGSEGIGLSVARLAAEQGALVVIAARSADKLSAAAKLIGPTAQVEKLDASDDEALGSFFARIDPIHHLVLTVGGRVGSMPFTEAPVAQVQAAFEGKLWTQYRAARLGLGKIESGGSITFTSGAASRRPSPGLAWLSAMNASIEALAKALAIELAAAKIRVNAICPGLVDTAVWDQMPKDHKAAFFAGAAQRLPAGHVATPDEIAPAFLHAMTNSYTTGTVIDIDGGANVLPGR